MYKNVVVYILSYRFYKCVTSVSFGSWQGVEQELESVGENMKSLEKSAEKALEREEKLKDKILQLQNKYKAAEAR
jgi:hypothetical protein